MAFKRPLDREYVKNYVNRSVTCQGLNISSKMAVGPSTIASPQKASKGKKVKERIVLREIQLRTTGRHLSMRLHSVICHSTEVTAGLHPNRASWYSIYRPRNDERLSWPSWLVTYRNGLPVHRRSPIRVLTGSDVAQLR